MQAMVEAIMSEQQANIRWWLRSQCPQTLGLSVWPSGDILRLVGCWCHAQCWDAALCSACSPHILLDSDAAFTDSQLSSMVKVHETAIKVTQQHLAGCEAQRSRTDRPGSIWQILTCTALSTVS